jgi:hypothetical protein
MFLVVSESYHTSIPDDGDGDVGEAFILRGAAEDRARDLADGNPGERFFVVETVNCFVAVVLPAKSVDYSAKG